MGEKQSEPLGERVKRLFRRAPRRPAPPPDAMGLIVELGAPLAWVRWIVRFGAFIPITLGLIGGAAVWLLLPHTFSALSRSVIALNTLSILTTLGLMPITASTVMWSRRYWKTLHQAMERAQRELGPDVIVSIVVSEFKAKAAGPAEGEVRH